MKDPKDFDDGVEYAFNFILNNLKWRLINGQLEAAITREEIEELKKNMPKKQ